MTNWGGVIARRLAVSGALLVLATSAAWFVVSAAPRGDVEAFGQADTAAARAADRAQAGLDASPALGLIRWWSAALRLDLGQSIRYQRPVGPLVAERAANSALLALLALTFAVGLGLPLGVVSATDRGWRRSAIRAGSVLLLSLSPLVLALLLSWMAARAGWPGAGGRSAAGTVGAWMRELAVPVTALALPLLATFERLQSRAYARIAGEPCLRNAVLRGVPERRVTWRHGWRLSIPPVAAVGGLIAGAVLSGALAVEVVTAWPGLGRLTFDALMARDAPLVAGCALATAVMVSAGALASDLVAAWADPRLRGTP